MTHGSASAYATPAVPAPRPGLSLWAPGLRQLHRLKPRRKARLLLLCSAAPPLLALLSAAPLASALGPLPPWLPLGLAAALLLPSLYAVVCLCMSLFEALDEERDEAAAQWREQAHDAAVQQAQTYAALQLAQVQIQGAVAEIARRTVALCGQLDAGLKDAERAAADLEAIQDEERHALQLMTALRARLLGLAQAVGGTAAAEIAQCHQLSERVGGAERLNERRIESMRLVTDRLLHRSERGMLEAQQLMVLTRQIQAAQAAAAPRLEQLQAAARVSDGAS